MTEPDGASRFLVDKLFPLNELNIIFGPNRVGKSTLLLQIADDWSNGRDVFGYKSFPRPFTCISCLTTLQLLRQHLEVMGIDSSVFPHGSLWDGRKREEQTIGAVIAKSREVYRGASVIFIDDLHALCQRGNMAMLSDALSFLAEVRREMTRENLTIVATFPSLKNPEADQHAMSKLFGANVFSSVAAAAIHIDFTSHSDPSEPQRTIVNFAKFSEPITAAYIFDGPYISPYNPSEEIQPQLDSWLLTKAPGELISTGVVVDYARTINLSQSTVKRWLRSVTKLGMLKKTKKGEYVIPQPNSLP